MKLPWLDSVDGLDVRTAPSERWLWFETFLLTAAALALSAWTDPADPLRIQSGFPWPVLGPVLAGLRYGFAAGFVSALLVLATLGVAINREWQPAATFPLAWATGIVVLAMLCGEFRDAWQRRVRRLSGANQYRGERLEAFTRSYHLLRVSHDRLEQALAGSGLSLREALTRLAQLFDPGQGLTSVSAQRLLDLLAGYGSLQQAALYPVNDSQIGSEPLASWGTPQPLSVDDPLLRQVLSRGELAAIHADNAQLEASRQSRLLAAVPLVDASGNIRAVLAVAAMPFFSFQHNTLTLLAVLCAHAADLLTGAGQPGSDERFARQLARAVSDSERFDLPATLVRVSLHGEHGDAWRALARRERRALDCWRERGEELTILMPLTERATAEQWLQRLQAHGAPAMAAQCEAVTNASAARALLPTSSGSQ